MATYLHVKLKMKGQLAEQAPYILTLGTESARELGRAVDLRYDAPIADNEYGMWTILTLDTLHEIQDFYKEQIENMTNSIVKYSAEATKYREMLPKVSNQEIFELTESRINDADEMVSWAKEEKEIAEYRLYDFNCLETMLDYNENFELVYYLA